MTAPLLTLPGQPIPTRPRPQPPTAENRQHKAALDADHDQWFASLHGNAARQRAVVDRMRARV